MKRTNQYLLLAACALGVVALSTKLTAADDATPAMPAMSCCSGMTMATPMSDADTNAVPDLLKICPVSKEKLGGDMGKPFVFVYKGQEVKLCCPGCKKDFDKDPAKYMKLIREADKKK
jgi:YHS domain-containing protein